MNTPVTPPRHRADGRRLTSPRGAPARSLVAGAAALTAAVVLAIGGAGSFAFWTGEARADGGTISSATTGLTVNGVDHAVIATLDASRLGPGTSVVTALTVANTGAIPLAVAVSDSAVTAQTNGLAAELMVRLTPISDTGSCAPGLTGPAGRIAAYPSDPSETLAAGASAVYCLELALDLDAPASVQGGTAAFTLTLTGTQVAP